MLENRLPFNLHELSNKRANGVCEHLLFPHLITDSPNRSRVNAVSDCVFTRVGGWEYGMGNQQQEKRK